MKNRYIEIKINSQNRKTREFRKRFVQFKSILIHSIVDAVNNPVEALALVIAFIGFFWLMFQIITR